MATKIFMGYCLHQILKFGWFYNLKVKTNTELARLNMNIAMTFFQENKFDEGNIYLDKSELMYQELGSLDHPDRSFMLKNIERLNVINKRFCHSFNLNKINYSSDFCYTFLY